MKHAAIASLLLFVSTARGDEVTITKTPDGIDFKIGSALVTRYHTGEKVAKPYFFPLLAKGDVPVTRSWPIKKGEAQETTDHIHQKSAWFCHGDVIPEGIELKAKVKGVEGVDFWSETPNHGRIVCIDIGEPKGGSVATKNAWVTSDGVKILDEVRVITLKEIGDARLLILEIELKASVCNLTFGDTKEGSMGIRVHDRMRADGGVGRLENAEGKFIASETYKSTKDTPIWGFKSAWCDYSGKIDGKEVGIAVFDDPKNPSPACWHARGYGLMAANPFGRDHAGFPGQKGNKDLVKLTKGDSLKFRYGILLHTGDSKTGKVADCFATFAGK